MTSSETQYATSATSTHDFEFDVTSYSDADLSGYEFHYTIDGTNSTMSGSQTLGLGQSEAFSFSLGLGDYSVSVSVYNASGELISETGEYSLSVVPPIPNFTLTPIFFNIFDANFSLGRSFLLSSSSCLKTDTPEALLASKNITKNVIYELKRKFFLLKSLISK